MEDDIYLLVFNCIMECKMHEINEIIHGVFKAQKSLLRHRLINSKKVYIAEILPLSFCLLTFYFHFFGLWRGGESVGETM